MKQSSLLRSSQKEPTIHILGHYQYKYISILARRLHLNNLDSFKKYVASNRGTHRHQRVTVICCRHSMFLGSDQESRLRTGSVVLECFEGWRSLARSRRVPKAFLLVHIHDIHQLAVENVTRMETRSAQTNQRNNRNKENTSKSSKF